jgi:hypothetical protein
LRTMVRRRKRRKGKGEGEGNDKRMIGGET